MNLPIDGSWNLGQVRWRPSPSFSPCVQEHDSARVAQAWLMGINPYLDDQVSSRLLREGELDTIGPMILDAARTFAVVSCGIANYYHLGWKPQSMKSYGLASWDLKRSEFMGRLDGG